MEIGIIDLSALTRTHISEAEERSRFIGLRWLFVEGEAKA
jgi:hypothetical protein